MYTTPGIAITAPFLQVSQNFDAIFDAACPSGHVMHSIIEPHSPAITHCSHSQQSFTAVISLQSLTARLWAAFHHIIFIVCHIAIQCVGSAVGG
jgi:hypothetical protein